MSAAASISPLKSVQNRLGVPPSPGLLGLSVSPELLILASPLTNPSPPSLSRGESQPPLQQLYSSNGLDPSQSPRRAFSAQPQASPRKPEMMLSPRRVLPDATQPLRPAPSPSRVALSSSSHAHSSLPLFENQPPTSSGLARSVGAGSSSTLASNDNTILSIANDSSQRRSQRSARPARAKATDLSIAKMPSQSSAAPIQPVPASSKTVPSPALSAAQLLTITHKNTNINKQHYNIHDVTTIFKDENRPPSPTSKIRKTIEDSVEVSKSLTSTSAAASKQEHQALKRAAIQAEKGGRLHLAGECQSASSCGLQASEAASKPPHPRAAGDDELFKSPIKFRRIDMNTEGHAQQRDEQRQPPRAVKWDRDLLKQRENISTPRTARAKETIMGGRSSKRMRVSGI